jgi:hypothetical protein
VKNLPDFRFNSKKKVAHFEVIVPGTHGAKRRRKTEEAGDVVEATTKYHAFRKEVSEAEKGPAVPHTLRWYFEKHWPAMKNSLSTKGRKDVENAMRVRLLPRIGDLLLEKINDAEVRDLVGSMKADDYAPETINGTLAKLRKFLRDAVTRDVIATNPVKGRLPLVKTTRLRMELNEMHGGRYRDRTDDLLRVKQTLSR